MPQPKEDLVFSANNLQVFDDCERRFELRYIKELKWPAVEMEPVLKSEEFLANGRRFHEMIQRDILGIAVPDSLLEQNTELKEWWSNYKNHKPVREEGAFFPEKTLVGSLEGHIIMATYDLIVVTDEDKLVIYDWKTWKTPRSAQWMKSKLQAKVYPWLLVGAGESLNTTIVPEHIEMRYWYASAPEQSFSFQYSRQQFEEDESYLSLMIERIKALNENTFALTEDVNKCKYCPYRSYCGRGKKAGLFERAEDELSEASSNLLGSLDDYESIAF